MTDLAEAAGAYVGIPYDELSCWGLLRRFYAEQLGIDLPEYAYPTDTAGIHAVVRRGIVAWRPVEEPEPGDAVLLWVRHQHMPTHVGVYVGDGRMLNTVSSAGAVIEPLRSGFWAKRIAGYYRHESRLPQWTLRVTPHPFAPAPRELSVPRGATIHEALLRSGIRREKGGQVRVLIGEEPIEERWWGKVRPRAGVVVDAQSVPGGWIQGAIALFGISSVLAGAGVEPVASIFGFLENLPIIGKLFSVGAQAEESSNPGAVGPAASPQAQGVGNRIDPWGPVPVAYCRDMRIYPPLAAPAYTEIVAGERMWRILLCVGAGRYYIDRTGETGLSGIEVGGVAIEDIQGAEWEVFDGATLDYPETVVDTEPVADPTQAPPLAYYRLGGLTDAMGGTALTATGGTTTGNATILAGQAGGSADFDGSNDYLEVATPPLSSLVGDWTVKFWIQPDDWSPAAPQTLVSSGASRGFEIALTEEGFEVRSAALGSGERRSITVPKPARTASGILVALRNRSGALELRFGGSRFPMSALNFSPCERLTVGARRKFDGTYERFYSGRMQELALYDFAVSDNELALLGDLGSAPPATPPPANPTSGSWQTRILQDSPQEEPINLAIQAPVAADGEGYVGNWITKEIRGEVDRLEVEVFFPSGIYRINDEGKKKAASIGFEIQYRRDGGEWVAATTANPTTTSHVRPLSATYFGVGYPNNSDGPVIQEPILGGVYWDVPLDRGYEIQYRVVATESVNNRAGVGNGNNTLAFFGDHELQLFRGVKRRSAPVRTTGVAYVGVSLPVRETGATVNEISITVSSMLKTVSGGAISTAETVTNNAAWAMLDALIGSAANPRPLASSRVDLAAFESFAARAGSVNLYADFRSNVQDLANTIAVGSFASLGYNGKWTPIEDRAGLTASQLITNRNSRSLGGAIHRPDLPHGLRVKFVDQDREWAEREILVFDDGYNEDGTLGNTAASKYESIEIRGLTTRDAVYDHVRTRLAMARLRNEEWRREMFLDAVRVHRGDVVKLQDWSALVGQHSARVTEITTGGGGTTVTAITVDEMIVYAGATNYGLVWRQPDGTIRRADVTNPGAGETTTITFSSAVPIAQAPAAGDLVAFGERNEEALDCLVREVVRKPGFLAELTLIPYAEAVFSAGDGPVAFDPVVANPVPVAEYRVPAAPYVERVESDERWLLVTQGGVQPRMRVFVRTTQAERASADRVQVRFRAASGPIAVNRGAPWVYSEWSEAYPLAVMCGPVETGQVVELQARISRADGRSSPWSNSVHHQVVGTSTPPPDVTEVRVDGELLTWSYNPAEVPDLAGFRVRFVHGQARDPGAVWSGAARIEDLIRGQSMPLSAVPKGNAVTVLVKAVDVSGNESATPAFALFVGRIDATNVITALVDSDSEGWDGIIINGSVDGGTGDLVSDVSSGDGIDDPMWGASRAPMFALDTTLDMFGVVASEMVYYREVAVPAASEGRRLWTELSFSPSSLHPLVDWAGYGPSPMFSSDPEAPMFADDYYEAPMFGGDPSPMFGAATDPMFPSDSMWPGPEWTEWSVWPGQIPSPRVQIYAFRITCPEMPGSTASRLNDFVVWSDVPDLIETLQDVPISTAGSRLPLTKLFERIDHVGATFVSSGGTGRTIEIVDRQAFGPLVRVLDSTGAAVAATIDAEVRGAPLVN